MNLRILLVESRTEKTLFLRDVLTEMDGSPCWSDWTQIEPLYAATWTDAAAILATEPVDIVLLNPDLEDCQGAETFRRSQAVAPQIPVILLIDSPSTIAAERMVRDGAQDFLMEKEVDCLPLAHAIRNAIERHRLLAAARATSTTDPLTGLMNRRSFVALADRDRMLAARLNRRMTIMVAETRRLGDMIRLYGEQRRDLVLIEAADHLRTLAGPSDLVGYLGEGRFGLAMFETDADSAEETWVRLHAATDDNIAVGAAVFDPNHPLSFDELLERAALDLAPAHAAAAHR